MAPRIITGIVFFVFCSVTAASQSIYNMEYRFGPSKDSTTYYALLIQHGDGGGLLRVRYAIAPAGEDIVIETELAEIPALENSGVIDSNTILLQAVNPRMIVGNSNVTFNHPFIVLKYNPASDYFEPVAVSRTEMSPGLPNGAVFSATLMERQNLTKAFMSQYFSEDEEFFKRYFNNSTRGLSPAEKNIRLHLMIVADTLDQSIGPACAKDIQRFTETFTGLTNFLGIRMLPTLVSGKQYGKKGLEDALKKLAPSSNDIVVFYYTGHGFRIPEKPRRFPNLKLKNFLTVRENFRDSISWMRQGRKDHITHSMNIEDIFNSIRAKKARLNLVISDCCNDDIFSVSPQATKPGKTKSSGVNWSEDNLRALFLGQKRTSILATAAQPGQRAACNNSFGSFFSYFFKSSLENYCSKVQPPTTWDVVIQSAQKQTTAKAGKTYCGSPRIAQNLCKQDPDYKSISGN